MVPLPYWHGSRPAGPAKLLPNFSRMLLRMRRNHKQLTSRARNVPVTRLRWREQSQLLQAVKFAAKNMPGFRLGLDEDFQMAGCFQELIHGYTTGFVEPYMIRGLQPLGPNRTTLEIIIPSQSGSHPRSGKKQPHCAHLIGLPTTVFCDCGIPMGASIKRKRDSGINCRIAICLLSGQCISTDLQSASYSSNLQFM